MWSTGAVMYSGSIVRYLRYHYLMPISCHFRDYLLRTCSAAEYQLQNILSMPIYAFRGAILRAFLQSMDADYMRTCHRICDRIFCENPHIAHFPAYINCVFEIAYAEIMPHSHIFAHVRICDAAYFAYLPHISAHYFAKFRIFSRIFCIKTARIF